jgi:hypothetical protein
LVGMLCLVMLAKGKEQSSVIERDEDIYANWA